LLEVVLLYEIVQLVLRALALALVGLGGFLCLSMHFLGRVPLERVMLVLASAGGAGILAMLADRSAPPRRRRRIVDAPAKPWSAALWDTAEYALMAFAIMAAVPFLCIGGGGYYTRRHIVDLIISVAVAGGAEMLRRFLLVPLRGG
jgi:hypothetical protein